MDEDRDIWFSPVADGLDGLTKVEIGSGYISRTEHTFIRVGGGGLKTPRILY